MFTLVGMKKAQEIALEDKAIQAELPKVKQKIKAQKEKEKAAHAKTSLLNEEFSLYYKEAADCMFIKIINGLSHSV